MKEYKTIQEVRDCKELSEIQKVQIEFYAGANSLREAIQNYEGKFVYEFVNVYEGSAIDYVTPIFDELYIVASDLRKYINYQKFCDDLIDCKDIYQFDHKHLITNANSV